MLESHLLPSRENNYLAAIVKGSGREADKWGLAFVDASCGEFFVTELSEENLILELGRLRPAEVLAPLRIGKMQEGDVVPRETLEIPELIGEQYRFKVAPQCSSSWNQPQEGSFPLLKCRPWKVSAVRICLWPLVPPALF
ncbi:MAG: DNA mismatch repair protein MutS [bacterium ADurb.Bin425]|nr:MAG: DNA mismatch repair protein MutS [bacterium ADurb.Bin425]